MAHFKTDVIRNRGECLKALTTERDIYAGAIARLNIMIEKLKKAQATWDDTIKEIDGTKSMLLMVGVDGPTLDLTEEIPPTNGG